MEVRSLVQFPAAKAWINPENQSIWARLLLFVTMTWHGSVGMCWWTIRNRSACTWYVQAGQSLIVHEFTKRNPFQVSFQTCLHYSCIDFWWGYDLRTGAEALPIYTRTEQLEKRTISCCKNTCTSDSDCNAGLCIRAFRFNGQFLNNWMTNGVTFSYSVCIHV